MAESSAPAQPWWSRGLRDLVATRATLDALERLLVTEARLAGQPWTSIAADLGVTRQGAYRRHGAIDPIARKHREAEKPSLESLLEGTPLALHLKR